MNILLLFFITHFCSLYAQDIREQLVFQNPDHNGILSPFTYEWTQILEQFHNTLGNRNTSKDDSACLYPVPLFECEPFVWNDAIIERDAYHLRPNVRRIYFYLNLFYN